VVANNASPLQFFWLAVSPFWLARYHFATPFNILPPYFYNSASLFKFSSSRPFGLSHVFFIWTFSPFIILLHSYHHCHYPSFLLLPPFSLLYKSLYHPATLSLLHFESPPFCIILSILFLPASLSLPYTPIPSSTPLSPQFSLCCPPPLFTFTCVLIAQRRCQNI
jgi:hypothetical protein